MSRIGKEIASGTEAQDATFIIAVGVMLLLCISTSYIYSLPRLRHLKLYFTEPAAQIVVGMLCLLIVPIFPTLHKVLMFNPDTFFLFLLPPIIFASGYNMKAGVFFSNIGVIFLLGILGTLLCTVIMTAAVFGLGRLFPDFVTTLSLKESLLFANALSAVDSVATVSVFTQLGVPSTLFTLVFGESVVNDAAAIVAYDSFSSLITDDGSIDVAVAFLAGGKIATICVGSISIGIICGAVCAIILKYTSMHKEPPLEIAVFWIFPLLSYFAAELMSMSGVMSILFCGCVMGHYTYYNLSLENQVSTPVSTTIVAFLSESFVFLYLGGAMPDATKQLHNIDGNGGSGLLLFALVLCYLSRGIVIFLFCFLSNLWRRKRINIHMQLVMWIGGAMRGAVSYALALKVTSKNGAQIWASTLFVVASTTLLAGSGTSFLIRWLKRNGKSLESDTYQTNESVGGKCKDGEKKKPSCENKCLETEESPLIKNEDRGRQRKENGGLWRALDEGYLIPLLRADSGRRISSIPYVSPCKGISRELYLDDASAFVSASGRGTNTPTKSENIAKWSPSSGTSFGAHHAYQKEQMPIKKLFAAKSQDSESVAEGDAVET